MNAKGGSLYEISTSVIR